MTQNFTTNDFGRYHLLEPLGEGGMAVVYKAFDTRLERDVAIKIIRTEIFPSEVRARALKRFEREAKDLTRLTHPNIVKITDYGEHDGKPFLVMPYLPGGTLKQLIKDRGSLPWQEAVKLLLPIADALDYAHSQGVIHRDIKPSNILYSEHGRPMLTDFGISKLFVSDETQTLPGTRILIGTPGYLALEQCQGIQVDNRSDIFSVGVVLYEMITGHLPFDGDCPSIIMIKQATQPTQEPSKYVPGLPKSVEKLLLKSLEKKPEDRYQKMAELAALMKNLLEVKGTTS